MAASMGVVTAVGWLRSRRRRPPGLGARGLLGLVVLMTTIPVALAAVAAMVTVHLRPLPAPVPMMVVVVFVVVVVLASVVVVVVVVMPPMRLAVVVVSQQGARGICTGHATRTAWVGCVAVYVSGRCSCSFLLLWVVETDPATR